QVFAKDLELPTGTSLITDEDVLIVAVSTAAEQDLGEDEDGSDEAAPAAEEAAAE
ncbi:MAG: hypothetical protein JWQ59_6, partial [Cryobacterium sp.]|nr:hypothetical protein [Cryobacterium sp.]